MAGKKGKLSSVDRSEKEGHSADNSHASLSKGTYMPVGTNTPLSKTAISPNVKSGSPSGGGE